VSPLALATALVLHFLGTAASATDLTQRLTAEEVACNERQLERLLFRLKAGDEVIAYPQIPKAVLVTYSNSVGFYEGLALDMQNWRLDIGQTPPDRAIERYLAFNINPSIRTLLVNPRRSQLGQVSLDREESNSNLVTPGGYFNLRVTIDPSLPGNSQPDLLEINNFEVPGVGEPYNGFIANSTKPGRGLTEDGLLTPCHEKFTAFDRYLFAILQRMLRIWSAGFGLFDSEGAIFRGEDPHTYRFNFYPIAGTANPALGRVAGELTLSWTPEGKLTRGVLRMLPLCQVGQEIGCSKGYVSSNTFLISPVFGGQELYSFDAALRNSTYFNDDGPGPAVTVDFEKLLAGTSWNSPEP
jgi:hypothetical protein